MNKGKSVLKVQLFGQLQITYNGITLTEEAIRSEMVSKLLAYILLHNERMLTVRELTDMLWGEDGGSDNPAGALKNLVYRLRTILKKTYGEDVSFLSTSQGSYSWNADIKVDLDTERLESCVKEAKVAEEAPDKLSYYMDVIDIYQGRFMDSFATEHWVVPLTAYYNSMVIRAVKDMAVICMKEKLYEEMERVLVQAIAYDNLDEELHSLMLESLVGQEKQSQAMAYYDETVKRFYEALGVRNLPQLKNVYKKVLAMKKVSGAISAEDISQDVQEKEEPNTAYICGYAVFQELYRIEARRVKRLKISEYVLNLTLTIKKSAVANESMERFLLNRSMDKMEENLKNSLRIGDVATRFSDSQFLVLLPTCSYEDSEMIAERIINSFQAEPGNSRVNIDYYIDEVG